MVVIEERSDSSSEPKLYEQGVPVWYVIRDREEENQYRMDNGENCRKIYDAAHKGRIYEADASLFYRFCSSGLLAAEQRHMWTK
jgi:hypothetical protein